MKRSEGLFFFLNSIYNKSGDNMNNEIKKQLALSIVLLIFVIGTMFYWYDNFIFHTYKKQVDYQYCFSGINEDVMIQGYELFQNSQKAYSGNGRLLSVQNNFFLKGDQLEYTVTFTDNHNRTYQYKNQYQIKSTNEVCYLPQNVDHKKDHQLEIVKAQMQFVMKRQNKVIYNEMIPLHANKLTIYTGGNKDYMIQNVYVTDNWLKTGYFSSTIDHLSEQYPKCVIDYVCCMDETQEDDVNNYDRIVHISGDTSTILKNEKQDIYFYDQQGQLSQKKLKSVITLLKSESDENPLIFVIELHGAIKAGGINE